MTKSLGRCASQIGCIQVITGDSASGSGCPFHGEVLDRSSAAAKQVGDLDEGQRHVLSHKKALRRLAERMLRSQPREADEVVSKPYLDPALKHSPRQAPVIIESSYRRIGYLEFTRITLSSDHAGVFFVWKSDRQKIRMIVDARPANGKFCDPPAVALKTADTFAKFEVEGNGDNLPDRFGLFAGLSDVKVVSIVSSNLVGSPNAFASCPLRPDMLASQGRQLLSSDLV